MGKNKRGNIVESELQNELNEETNGEKTKAKDSGEVIKVYFLESQRSYAVDKEGNVRIMTWWENTDEDGNKYITNGEKTLQIGDYITYDANDQGEHTYIAKTEKTGVSGDGQIFSSNCETKWRLLGIEHSNDKDCLMLVPDTPIKSTDSKGLKLRRGAEAGYEYGIEVMENISEIYGYGKGADHAKAMTVEDINEITGYNPMNTGNGTTYKQGEMLEYLNKITITRTSFSVYEISGSNGAKSTYNYGGFWYFNEEYDSFTIKVGESITLTATYYKYYPTTLTDSSEGDIKGISKDSREYKVLFPYNKSYWLASRYTLGGGSSVGNINIGTNYGFFNVTNGVIETKDNCYIVAVGGNSPTPERDVMPIVYLKTDIQLEETENQVNSCTEWKIIQ